MYCIYCGVKLQEGEITCPLCHTKLIEAARQPAPATNYPPRYPEEVRRGKHLALGLLTTLMLVASLVCLICCLKLYGRMAWSGYVILGCALAWTLFVIPLWVGRWRPMLFLPVDVAAISGFLLYVCLYLEQHWFLSFAFPVTLLLGLLLIAAVALFRYVKKGRLYITGGLLAALGAICLLIEFFQHVTFGTGLFVWSLYAVAACGALGLFLLLAAMIPPLKDYLERKFFY